MLFFACCGWATAQSLHANNWMFGSRYGLNFSTPVPHFVDAGKFLTKSGCGTISDTSGNLIFSTSGLIAYDKFGQPMQYGKGLTCNGGVQSGLIVRKPNSSLYYIFGISLSQTQVFKSDLLYSEVDMSANGGLGSVSSKNNLLQADVTEHLTAVPHANGRDVWVIAHKGNSDEFLFYLVTANSPPILHHKQAIGIYYSLGYSGLLNVKVSPDHKTLAISTSSIIDLYDFDNTTGKLSNLKTISAGANFYPQTLEFSPNSKLLYAVIRHTILVGTSYSDLPWLLKQYDLEAANIEASAVSVRDTLPYTGQLQLASDGKIYCNSYQSLRMIDFPNKKGKSCGLSSFHFRIDAYYSEFGLGFPQFYDIEFQNKKDFEVKTACASQSATFVAAYPVGIDSLFWKFGDGATSSEAAPEHIYSLAQSYNVTLYYFKNNILQDSLIKTIKVGNDIRLATDLALICADSTSLTIDVLKNDTIPGEIDIRSLKIIVQDYNYVDATAYADTVRGLITFTPTNLTAWPYFLVGYEICNKEGCCKRTTLFIFNLPSEVKILSSPICNKDSVYLYFPLDRYFDSSNSYQWAVNGNSVGGDSSKLFLATVKEGDVITVQGDLASNCKTKEFRDTLVVKFLPAPSVTIAPNKPLCNLDSLTLTAVTNAPSVVWNTGDTASSLRILPIIGTSWSLVATGANNCKATASYTPILDTPIALTILPPQPQVSEGDTISLFADVSPIGNYTYVWSPSSSLSCSNCSRPVASPDKTTVYKVTVTNTNNCQASAMTALKLKNNEVFIPNIFSPNNDGFNDYFTVFGGENLKIINKMSIFDRSGRQVYYVENIAPNVEIQGWDGKFLGQELVPQVFVYAIEVTFGKGIIKKYQGDVTLLK